MTAEVSGIARMNIAGMDDETLAALRGYYAAALECAANDETRTDAAAYLAAFDDETALRSKP